MFERTTLTRAAVILALALGAAPRTAQAQPEPARADREQLLRRIDELEARYEIANEVANHADSLAAAERLGGERTIVHVGPLQILTTPVQAGEARVLWQQEWDVWAPIAGEQGRKLRGPSVTVPGLKLEATAFNYYRSIRPHELDEQVVPVRSVEFRRPVSDQRVREAIHAVIGAALTANLPADLRHWSGGYVLGGFIPPSQLYRQFVRAPTSIAQSCVQGSTQACWTALGEMDPSSDLLATWYPPGEQQAWIGRLDPRSRGRDLNLACLTRSDLVACREVMKQESTSSIMPFPVLVRASLLSFALERGGPGSLDRLVASIEADGLKVYQGEGADAGRSLGAATHIREHLGRAANMDPDVLIGLWRDQVLAGRSGPPTPDPRTRANSFLWVTLLAGLATRSTRWRLG